LIFSSSIAFLRSNAGSIADASALPLASSTSLAGASFYSSLFSSPGEVDICSGWSALISTISVLGAD